MSEPQLNDPVFYDDSGYIGQVVEREREQGYEVGALLIAQMLNNWGANSFDIVARHYLPLKTGE